MTTRDDFTTEEWAAIGLLPGQVIGAVAIADGRNLIKLAKETAKGGSALTAEVAKYPGNPLMAALTEGGSGSAPESGSTEEAANARLDEAAATFAMLHQKGSPEHVAQLGAVLKATAQAVAEAAGSGFFGGGEDRVDPREQAVIDRLNAMIAG